MICPKCKTNLKGELIYETFLKQYRDEQKALDAAKMYGATKDNGKWGKEIGIYDMNHDRIITWRCPDCKHEWSS